MPNGAKSLSANGKQSQATPASRPAGNSSNLLKLSYPSWLFRLNTKCSVLRATMPGKSVP